jgi:diguanylate cyclase (GGDEF)-like protein
MRIQQTQKLEDRRLKALVRVFEVEAHSLEKMLGVAVREAATLSESPIGYIYYPEEGDRFTMHGWSKDLVGGEDLPEATTTHGLAKPPIWDQIVKKAAPIVVNHLEAATSADGAGSGAPLGRFMAIPVVSRGKTVAVVGVANKPFDYADSDVSQLAQTMDVVWRIAERQRAEDELRILAQTLESRVGERTAEYERANAELGAANAELATANAQLQKLLREQEGLQAELAYRALHDPLTGLANRAKFQQRLEYASRVGERGVGVLWIDLDHFKEVNDIFGHAVGDEMLVAVADRLRDVVRERDDVARMGGDEFAIVLPNVIESEAQMVGERVLTVLTDRDSFRLQVRASVGVSWQPPGAEDWTTLLRHADQAMYRAKASGGGIAISY